MDLDGFGLVVHRGSDDIVKGVADGIDQAGRLGQHVPDLKEKLREHSTDKQTNGGRSRAFSFSTPEAGCVATLLSSGSKSNHRRARVPSSSIRGSRWSKNFTADGPTS